MFVLPVVKVLNRLMMTIKTTIIIITGQRILTSGRIAEGAGSSLGKFNVTPDCFLLLWPANQNADRQHAGKFRRQSHWKRCSEACDPTSSPQKCPFSRRFSASHLMCSFLGLIESTHGTASRRFIYFLLVRYSFELLITHIIYLTRVISCVCQLYNKRI